MGWLGVRHLHRYTIHFDTTSIKRLILFTVETSFHLNFCFDSDRSAEDHLEYPVPRTSRDRGLRLNSRLNANADVTQQTALEN
jgi:hypothetical protein